ncbi:hypothetical protein PPERSA_01138 [Pseudocohnilembus persalinus]|uniref:Uncharacterized protein n=1 Tax=Pseudocohnilembus persalinus TaxID=266149 RepID=A0A0V0QUN0_PSEPJ|nr:hypothetical protein PPERSA_01138 [Pseudocohnilembus persalinus]|eukprot:KRX06060.1 hypothetical protein PPERSA_01138 [Pseudocohnilembus persalinus]
MQDGISLFLLSDGVYYLLFTIFFFVSINSRPPLIPGKINFKNMIQFEKINALNTQNINDNMTHNPNASPINNNQLYNKKYNNCTSFVQFMRRLQNNKEFKQYCKKKQNGFFILTRILTSNCNRLVAAYMEKK